MSKTLTGPIPGKVEEKLAYSAQSAAAALDLSVKTIYRLIQRGELETIDALRTVLIPASSIQKFLKGGSR